MPGIGRARCRERRVSRRGRPAPSRAVAGRPLCHDSEGRAHRAGRQSEGSHGRDTQIPQRVALAWKLSSRRIENLACVKAPEMKTGIDGVESIVVCPDHPGDIADLQDLLVLRPQMRNNCGCAKTSSCPMKDRYSAAPDIWMAVITLPIAGFAGLFLLRNCNIGDTVKGAAGDLMDVAVAAVDVPLRPGAVRIGARVKIDEAGRPGRRPLLI